MTDTSFFTAEHYLIIMEGIAIAWLLIVLWRRGKKQAGGTGEMERFRSLFLLAPVPMAFISEKGQVLYLNRRFTAVLGYAREDIPDMDTWFTLAFPDPLSRREARKIWENMIQIDEPGSPGEFRVYCRDGSVRIMELAASRLGEIILVCFFDVTGRDKGKDGGVAAVKDSFDIARYRQTEKDLRIFMESVNNSFDAVGMATPDGRHYYQNRAFDRLFGDIGNIPPEKVFVDKNIFRELFAEIMAGRQWSGEVKMYASDGRIVDVYERAYPVKDEEGNITALVGLHTDITDKKRAENELREKERFLFDVIENSGALIYVKNREGRYEMANRKWEDVTGLAREIIIGRTDLELFPGRTGEDFRRIDVQVMESGELIETEEILRDEKGERYFISIKFPMRDNSGAVTGLCGMSTEITDRRLREDELRESGKRAAAQRSAIAKLVLARTPDPGDVVPEFRLIAQTLSETVGTARASVWRLSEDGSRLHCITLYESGPKTFTSGEVLETITFPSYFKAIHSENRVYAEDAWNDPRTRELSEFYLKPLGITALLDAGIFMEGRLMGVVSCEHVGDRRIWHPDEESFVSTMASLAAQVFAGEERRRIERERERLREQLDQAIRLESIGRLAGGVAHDFNNMLGVILGRAELALDKVDESNQIHKSLREIRRAAERSADLTKQLLAFARKQTIDPRSLNLNDTVGGMLLMLRRLLGEDIELLWKPGGDLWNIRMDPTQVDQVLANLCVNARDAITGPGRIAIETANRTMNEIPAGGHFDATPGDYVTLTVTDNGCGMDEATMASMFEPFFTTKEKGMGTGLGLATVYGIVRQNNGFIDVQSEPGAGSVFSIYLPRYDTGKTVVKEAETAVETRKGHETVLLVEDEADMLDVAATMLEELGYRVLKADGTAAALEMADEHSETIDLLITDVIMPGMNGRELADALCENHPGVKCLYMSGYTASVIERHGVLEEGMHFLQKPFSLKDLSAKVRRALEG